MSASLTDYEKARVLFFLGYSIFEDDGNAIRALNSLVNYPIAGDFIRPILTKLDQIDASIQGTIPIAQAIQDGTIQLRAHYTLKHLQKLGQQQINRLATFTKISICSDVFSSQGSARNSDEFYSGDPSEVRSVNRLGGG